MDQKTSVESFLKDFHRRHPGCTADCFEPGFSDDGRCSYDHIIESLPETSTTPLSILDLACGDGVLLQYASKRSGASEWKLHGLDMSDGELAKAKRRLASFSNVELREGNALALPYESASFDFIFCHMAFMLMNEIEQVVREIHRCLKPGGTFSAVVGGKFIPNPFFDEFGKKVREAFAKEGRASYTGIGDPRTKSEEGLLGLFQAGFQDVTAKSFQVVFRQKPEELRDFFLLTYEVFVLSEKTKENLWQTTLPSLQKQRDANGVVRIDFGLRQITARKIIPGTEI